MAIGNTDAARIEAPFDSDDYPKSVLIQLIQGDEIESEHCDLCGRVANDWPTVPYGWGVPAAMFQAALYCASCVPFSYDEGTGERVNTLTGDAA